MALAVKEGLIGKDDVQSCMNEQKRQAEAGRTYSLEQVVIAKGHMTAAQFDGLRAPAEPDLISIEEASRIPIYDFHQVIGQGGMATVFAATHKETGQPRAVKILYKEHVSTQQFVNRFLREGKLLKAFDCPSIARGYEYGRAGKDLYFMGMELIDGPSLQDMIEEQGTFNESMALHCVTEAARALAYMRSQGVVHRDIKPDNIMWNSDGRVMLVDLGFAKSVDQSAGEDDYENETCGTVQYISPEQAKGKANLDVRADIYSLGATLYHLVFGQLPFSGKDSMEIMAKQVMESLDAHALKGGKISMHMHYFIEKMMAKDREIRYQTAQEAVDDIETVLAGAADLQFDPGSVGGITPKLTSKISSGRLDQVSPPSGRFGKVGSNRTQKVSSRMPATRKQSNRVPKTGSGRTESVPPTASTTKTVRLPAPRRTTGKLQPEELVDDNPTDSKQVRFPSQRKRRIH